MISFYMQADVAVSYCCYAIKLDWCLHVTTIYFVSSYYKKNIFMCRLMCHIAAVLLRSMLSIARVIARDNNLFVSSYYNIHTRYPYVQADVAVSYCCYAIKLDWPTCLRVTTIYFVSL